MTRHNQTSSLDMDAASQSANNGQTDRGGDGIGMILPGEGSGGSGQTDVIGDTDGQTAQTDEVQTT